MDIRAVKFRVGHEWRVGGLLRPPSLAGMRAPAVLMLHGFPGFIQNEDIAAELCRRGMTVFLPRWAGCWGSGGRFRAGGLLRDAHAALRLLKRYPGVDRLRVGVLGYSMGGWAALRLAAEASVAGVAALAAALPRADRPEDADYLRRNARVVSLGDPDEAWREYLETARADEPRRYMRDLAWTPLLLVHGMRDRVAPVSVSRRLAAFAGPPKTLIELADEEHELQADRPAVVDGVARWFEEVLAAKEDRIPEVMDEPVDVGGGD